MTAQTTPVHLTRHLLDQIAARAAELNECPDEILTSMDLATVRCLSLTTSNLGALLDWAAQARLLVNPTAAEVKPRGRATS